MHEKVKNTKIYLGIGALILLAACSTKKNAFVNRNWHAVNTKYNVLYNGNLAFEQGREELRQNYKENYWALLPVERLQVTDEIRLDSEGNNPNFERAEEKATKAIQKHAMDIEDRERNPQTDEAFLLLGKARYFDQRYVPALEAFNYILYKHDQSNQHRQARIWREKTNMRLDNPELAIKNLKNLLKYESLSDQEFADAQAVIAQCFVQMNQPDSAIRRLKYAQTYVTNREEQGRYLFIIGQLYNRLGKKDSANFAFDKIIALKRKTPRVYWINAHLKKIHNIEVTDENKEFLYEYLTELEENRENRPFLDKIFRQKAIYHFRAEEDSLGIVYYNKSLRRNQEDKVLNALNYLDLAEYHFDERDYRGAGGYYDSVLQNMNEKQRDYRLIKKKRDNLEDVIKYEDIVEYTDSVLDIYEMNPDKRKIYFQQIIDKLQAQRKAEEEAREKRRNTGLANFLETKGGKSNKGKFYFYNIASLGYGKTDFESRWGNRPLEDDWRWSNKVSGRNRDDLAQVNTAEADSTAKEDPLLQLDYYLEKVPTRLGQVDSLRVDRNFALYQLGLIYMEKFKDNELAAERLERVLAQNPEERLILPSKYNLYKIYQSDYPFRAEEVKSDIIQNHSDSRYAQILLNPDAVLAGDTESPDALYDQLYKKYEDQKFLEVITQSQEYIDRFTGDQIVPKFEMLKANSIGRLQGFEPFKEALNYVALNYPNNPEGKKAEYMVKEQLPKLAGKEFSKEEGAEGAENWKVVFPYKIREDESALKLKNRLEEIIKDLAYKNKISKDVYNLEDQFVIVHGFRSKEFALGFVELINTNRKYRVKKENFVISSKNYKVIQVHKNITDYLAQVELPKP